MNTVNDLRLALSDEARRLQPPAGLEARVLQQALQGSRDVVSARRAELPNVVPLWEPRRRGEFAAGIAAILLAAIVIGSFAYIRAVSRPHAVTPPITSGVMQVLPQVMVGNVGWADGPQRTIDGGLHWRDASPRTANRAKGGNSNFFLDTNHAWVTADSGPAGLPSATTLVVFATADGGQTWTQSSLPISGAGSDYARVDFIDPQHGWLITDSGQGGFDRAVYATADGGRTWTQMTSAQQSDGSILGTLALGCGMSGLTFTSLHDGWLTWSGSCSHGATGEQTGPSVTSRVAVTHDGGQSWQPVVLPQFPSSAGYTCNVHSPVFTSSQGVIPVDCAGNGSPGLSVVYATNNGGRSWSVRNLPIWSQQMDFVDATTGWTFGSTGLDLYRTTDGGNTWSIVKRFASEQNAYGLSLSFVDLRTGFALTSRYAPDGKSGYSTMWKTTDGGLTWSVLSSVPSGPRCC